MLTNVPRNSVEPGAGMDRPTLAIGESAAATPAGNPSNAKTMVAEVLGAREASVIVGQPLSLATALAAVNERPKQIEVVHAYWRLVEALANYHYSLDYEKRLQRLTVERREGESALRSALASAAAAAHETELAVVTAQYELAAAVQLAANASLPVPSDQPHTGGYRTSFKELFSKRPAPAKTRLLDQTLPIEHGAIDARATAVEAAHHAAAAAAERYRADRSPLSEALVTADELRRQQRAFIAAVCRYNNDIASYALSVAPPGATARALVGMLIGSSRDEVRPMSYDEESRTVGQSGTVVPAYPGPTGMPSPASTPLVLPPPPSLVAPPGAGTAVPVAPAMPGGGSGLTSMGADPTLLPVPGQPSPYAPSGRRVPKPVPVRTVPIMPESYTEIAPPAADVPRLPGPGLPTPVAPEARFQEKQDGSDDPPRPLVPVTPTPHTSNRPLGDPYGRWQVAADAIYSRLWEATPAVQARELTATLHLDRNLPAAPPSISLEDALGKRVGSDRRALIESYWLARQRAAEYQLCLQQMELLQGVDALANAQGASPHHEPSLRRRALELGMAAAAMEAEAALAAADYELATHMGQAENTVYPPPKTTPYCGPYRLNLESLSPEIVQTWPVRRLSAVIPKLYKTLEHRAASLVQADGLRAKYTERYGKGEIPSDQVLDAINRQGEETLAFLTTLTDYNQAIAQFAVAVLPANIPNDTLLAVLGAKGEK
jgi:hypothetical protein